MQLESLYQEIILDHYRHPHHKGLREPYDAEVRHVNPTCGDEVRPPAAACPQAPTRRSVASAAPGPG